MSIGFTILKQFGASGFTMDSQCPVRFTSSEAQYGFGRQTNAKFQEDKLFLENQQYIYGIDGPVLNLQELKKNYAISDWSALFLHLYEKHKENLGSQLKGDICGFVFNKQTEELLVFNNGVGTRRIYYGQTEKGLIITPALLPLSKWYQAQGLPQSLNRFAAYSLLTYGTMPGNSTLIQNVHRLLAGEALLVKSGQLLVHRFVDYNDVVLSERTAPDFLEEINERFVHLLRLEMDKDQEYGYHSIGTLSGGLDSRMCLMLAHKMGYNVQPFCFSQSGYYDEPIARDIAKWMGKELWFFPLDNARHLFDLEENLEHYDALSFYTTSAHFAWALKQLDLSQTGMIHTGMLGDGVFGSTLSAPKLGKPNLVSKLISNKLYPKIEKEIQAFAKNYASEESYSIYNRMFNLTISGTYICAPYGYHSTPFMDADLIQLLQSIPPEMKYFQRLYIQWINQYHPEVNQFTWERTRMKPTAHWKTLLSRYTLKMEQLFRKYTGNEHLLSMSPYKLWAKQYPEIKQFYQQQYDQRVALLSADKELAADVRLLFETGNPVEQAMALTLLGGIERYGISLG
jgi:asparagine synthase (glutamine-hydrolysing)